MIDHELAADFPLNDYDKGWHRLAELAQTVGYLASQFYERHRDDPRADEGVGKLGSNNAICASYDNAIYALGIGPDKEKMTAVLDVGYGIKSDPARPEVCDAVRAFRRAMAVYRSRLAILEPVVANFEGLL